MAPVGSSALSLVVLPSVRPRPQSMNICHLTTSLYKCTNDSFAFYHIHSPLQTDIRPRSHDTIVRTRSLVSFVWRRRRVIACATVNRRDAASAAARYSLRSPRLWPALAPADLKRALQDKIDEASQTAEVVVLGYGLLLDGSCRAARHHGDSGCLSLR